MGQEYIIDSNVVIDYLGQKLPPAGTAFVDKLSRLFQSYQE